jgi:hypothetical protein
MFHILYPYEESFLLRIFYCHLSQFCYNISVDNFDFFAFPVLETPRLVLQQVDEAKKGIKEYFSKPQDFARS